MLKSLPVLLLTATICFAAPIPKGSPPPDPLGRGYIGFFPIDTESLIIERIERASPAALSGLRPGDEFVQIGSFKPKTFEQLRSYVMNFRPGTQVKVVVRRQTKMVTLRLTLGVRPADADNINRFQPFPPDDNEP
ncbi:MAG: PDZ domain-containing protein [Gemmataceae bacterium]